MMTGVQDVTSDLCIPEQLLCTPTSAKQLRAFMRSELNRPSNLPWTVQDHGGCRAVCCC